MEVKSFLFVVSWGLGLFVGLGFIGLAVSSWLTALLDLDGSSGTLSGVDVGVLDSDRISLSSPKYTPSGLGASSEVGSSSAHSKLGQHWPWAGRIALQLMGGGGHSWTAQVISPSRHWHFLHGSTEGTLSMCMYATDASKQLLWSPSPDVSFGFDT